jgi:hypothetical protein
MDLSSVWNSPRNTPSSVEREQFVRETTNRLRRARRRQLAFLVWTGSVLALMTAGAVYGWIWRPAETRGAWPLFAVLAAQWCVFLHWLRDTAGGRKGSAAEAGVRESLEALARETERERRGQIAVLGLFAVVAPLVVSAILYLGEVGKMAPHEALSAGALFSAVILVAITVIMARLFRIVLPRRRRLALLLEQYRDQ